MRYSTPTKSGALIAVLVLLGILIFPLSRPLSAAISIDGWGTQSSGTAYTLYGVWGTSPTDILACGEVGTVLHSNGVSWSPMTSGVTNALYGIWGSASDNVFAVGQNGCVIRFNGTSWETMSSGTLRHLNAVWGSSASDVYAVGNSGTVVQFDGNSWSSISPPGVTSHLRGVWGSSCTDVFVVGDGGIILHYDSANWTTMASGSQPKFAAVWGTSSMNVYAVGDGGTIMHYDSVDDDGDGGPWDAMTSGVGANLYGIWGPSADEAFAVGASGRILHYADTSWSLMNSGVGSELRGIYGFSSINAYVVGANGTILHYKEPAPIITTISPNQGNQGQSLAITITGSNFAEATAIDLGSGIDIADWNIDSNLQISANITISSSAPTGPRDLSITNPYGTGTLPDAFLVPHPAVTSVTPDTGNQGETIAVTISGSNLGGTTAVNFGLGISPDALEISSPSTLSLTISIAEDAISGPREVLVMTPDHVTAWSSFVIPTATGDSVNPDSAVQGETVVVSITGNNLFGATGVSFGDNVTVSSFDVVSPTQINASITIDGLASPGSRTISIVTPSGTVTMADAFQVISASPPSVSSLSPTSGTQGQTLEVVIDGTDFERVTSVDFGEGITVNAVTINSPTRITVSITISETALPGARDLSVLALSGSDSLNDAFGVTAAPLPVPTVSGISPASARQGETLDVVITGTNLDGVTSIELGEGIKVNSFTVDSPTQITLNLTVGDDAASGPRDVQVTGPGGSDSLSAGLEVEGSGGTPFWVWILIALIPLLLILFFLLLKRKKQEQESRA